MADAPWKRGMTMARTPENQAIARATRKAKASVKQALLNAFDTLGNEAFFVELGRGSAEDRRCLAIILAKLLPLEVAAHVDHSLSVKIVKQVGEREIVIDSFNRTRDAVTGERLPVALDLDRDPVPIEV